MRACVQPIYHIHLFPDIGATFCAYVFVYLANNMRSELGIVAATLAAASMVNALTPEGMLAAPRRGAAVANPSGVRGTRCSHIANTDKSPGICDLVQNELLVRGGFGDHRMGISQLDLRRNWSVEHRLEYLRGCLRWSDKF